MKAMRFHITLALSIFSIMAAFGQQLPQYSQYFLTQFDFNPAVAGSENHFEALAVHRSQWTGITDAPRTYFIGLHAPDKSGKMGFGGSAYTDVAGPTRRAGFRGAYAYHLTTSETTKLSLGVSFGLLQFSIDGSQIELRDPSDRTLMQQMESETKPDASFGALWYGEKFKLGVSAAQILHNRIDLYPGAETGRLAVHYYFYGSYLYDLSTDFQIEPNVVTKFVSPIDPQMDIGMRVIYQGKLWLGGSFRTYDAAAVYAGYEIQDYLAIGYSYDITTSDLKRYSAGTHEIVLRVRFGKKDLMISENSD